MAEIPEDVNAFRGQQFRWAKGSVQTLIKKRYGSMSKLPMNELAVAPSDIARSSLLIEVPRKSRSFGKKR